MTVTENELDNWVRGNARKAQGVIVELLWRLVSATAPDPRQRRFPLGDSIGQHGADGELDVEFASPPWVPAGHSLWEVGTGEDAGKKATQDYGDLTASTPADVRLESTFVFVTPQSGARGWGNIWTEKGQATWLRKYRKRAEWGDVRVMDGTLLVDWIRAYPPVGAWLRQQIGLGSAEGVETLEDRWQQRRRVAESLVLHEDVFLAGRDEARAKLDTVLDRTNMLLSLGARSPEQVVDFVAAHVATLPEQQRVEIASRCFIVSRVDAWERLVTNIKPLILVGDASLDLGSESGARLVKRALHHGHAVVRASAPGGRMDATSVPLRTASVDRMRAALERSGFREVRARTLAERSAGNVLALMRSLEHTLEVPVWADGAGAIALMIAALLGAWSDEQEADRAAAEVLAGASYASWTGTLRDAMSRRGSPLTYREQQWHIPSRYDAWYALGPRVFDAELDRLQQVAVSVLAERDPQFELVPGERFAARVYGKTLRHSDRLRQGLATTLALLGSRPDALTACSPVKAQNVATLVVRELLREASWEQWASLDRLLPLLAEASPDEFLACVERMVVRQQEVVDTLFAQESGGATGGNHTIGLLWALETLAWSPRYLSRVLLVLGGLAQRDHGGTSANRPRNSLSTILLPWHPQTCAEFPRRLAAVRTLARELPDVGWTLLLALLPNGHTLTVGASRPGWRDFIPDDWSAEVTRAEYHEEMEAYGALAIELAESRASRLAELVERWNDLPTATTDLLCAHLESSQVAVWEEPERALVWEALRNLADKHRAVPDASWAMPAAELTVLDALAARVCPTSPALRYRPLFDHDAWLLFGVVGEGADYDTAERLLDAQRTRAVDAVFAAGGSAAVLAFAESVEQPWQVGAALAAVGRDGIDHALLPCAASATGASAQCLAAYIGARHRRGGWEWLDTVDRAQWSLADSAALLTVLPFEVATWDRAEAWLGTDSRLYWQRALPHPAVSTTALDRAIDALRQVERPDAALQCVHRLIREGIALDPALTAQVLLEVASHSHRGGHVARWEVAQTIRMLQEDPRAKAADIERVEWAFLELLRHEPTARPRHLEARLARDPAFFGEMIRAAYRPRGTPKPAKIPEETQQLALQAHRLLEAWGTPPGCEPDGTVDGATLSAWVDRVLADAKASGHFETAAITIGEVLWHAPSDLCGLWIHRDVASILDAAANEPMRRGFRTSVYNSRGAHWVDPTGRAEDELAARYHAQSAALENAGFPRFAATIRQLAESFADEAERTRAHIDSDE